jgi:hypothetical protein
MSFLAPAFLFGLLAVAVPLWLHRVARADPTHRPFASVMLLETSETQRAAKRQLRYWLLLATRLLLLIALVIAFAGPLGPSQVIPGATGDTRLHAILVDASLSMQYGDRWARAMREAEEVLQQLKPADRVMLVRAAGRRVEVVHDSAPASEAGAVRAALANLKPGLERLDYGLAMSTADSWLGSPRPRVVLHLIGDLQQSAAPLRFADLEPPPDAELNIHDVSGDAAQNVFIAAADLVTTDTRMLKVALRSTFTRPVERTLILLVDGKERARRTVELPAASAPVVTQNEFEGRPPAEFLAQAASDLDDAAEPRPGAGQTVSTLDVTFPDFELTAGTHRIEVAIEPGDELPQDDRFRAVVEHAEPKALLIAGESEVDAATYFAAAVGALAGPRLILERRASNQIDSGRLSTYSLLVIPDISALSSGAAERVRDYIAGGGAVLAAIGSGFSGNQSALLEGWRIGEVSRRATRVGEIVTAHPVLREAADWHRVRFFRQRSVQPAEGDAVLIRYADGSPLLVEHRVGAGRALVLTTAIEREASDLAIRSSFVHFILEAARYLVGADAIPTSSTVGSVVQTGLTAAGGGQIFDPRGERVLDLAETTRADRLIPDQTGFYEIRGAQGVRWLAANIDTRESDLTALPSSYVQRWQALRARETTSSTKVSQAQAAPRSLGPTVMWVAALLLLAELLLANRALSIRREVPR